MRTKEEAIKYFYKQLTTDTNIKSLPRHDVEDTLSYMGMGKGAWHYGRCEGRDLIDYIYGDLEDELKE